MEVDHDLVVVDEFDALSIQVKAPPPPTASPVVTREKFPAKTHARKVAKELGVTNGLIYLPGQSSKVYEDSDLAQPFRQHRYFYYLSGADFANCAVTYDIGRSQVILWIPYTDPRQVLWFGTTPGIEDCKRRLDVDDVRFTHSLDRFLIAVLGPTTPLFVLHESHAPPLDKVRGPVEIDSTRLRPAMDAARVVKTDYEVAMIRRANAISSAAHRAVLRRLKSLTNEREIEAIFRAFCTAHGAKHQAYPVIAGSGPNAGTLHYDDNNQPLAGRQLVVLDAGCEWACYSSDITRTLPLTGSFSPEASQIYAVVERMQAECLERIKPGVIYYTLHLHAHMVAVTELLRLGILHGGTAREIFVRGTAAAFFPHGLGHHLGLETHDVSGRERLLLASKVARPGGGRGAIGKREWISPEMFSTMFRDAVASPPPYKGRQKLEKNMVITVEPGIYFCREYIEAYFLKSPIHSTFIDKAVLEKYYPVGGVRIEDDILVTETGYENLTTAPKGEEELRNIFSECATASAPNDR